MCLLLFDFLKKRIWIFLKNLVGLDIYVCIFSAGKSFLPSFLPYILTYELILPNGWPTKGVYALFPAGTIVTDFHHCKFLTCHKLGLNLHRIWVPTLLNEAVQYWWPPHQRKTFDFASEKHQISYWKTSDFTAYTRRLLKKKNCVIELCKKSFENILD